MTHRICCKKNKPQKTRVLGTLFILALAGLSFFVILNIADFISSTLMSKSSIFYGGNVRTNGYVMYGICFYQVSGKPEAEALSKSIQNQGGAGYVNQQGDYFIYASMYSSFSDATSVKEKLGGSAGIINISVPAISFKFGGNADEVVAAIGDLKKIYQSLYQTSIDYDQGVIDTIGAKGAIEDCMELVQQNIEKISDIKDNKIKLVVSYLNKTLEHLEALVQRGYWGLEFNAAIKYAYFEAIFNNIALAKAL
ncbi:MAG: hypothetical protein LBN07_01770 [Christensenellaceae bacterium]|jgi:hypothetical protein|nr:hypothetical protein [Christensenellaceae bacterium]